MKVYDLFCDFLKKRSLLKEFSFDLHKAIGHRFENSKGKSDTLKIYTEDTPPENWITNAFNWNDSGSSYFIWNTVNNLWLIKLEVYHV